MSERIETVSKLKRNIIKYSFVIFSLFVLNFIASSKLINADFPWYSSISVFLLININIILLLILLLVIFRNLGKLFLGRRKTLFGTRLQTKLVIFSIMITVLPVFVVFLFSTNIINNSIDKWFDVQIEQALKSSIDLMQKYQNQVEQDLIEQTSILSKLVTSKAFLLQKNYEELKKFGAEYLEGNRIDGILIYNSKMLDILHEDKKYYLNLIIEDEVVKEVLKGKQIAKYSFFENSQIYWVGQPIASRVNENIVAGAIFIYKTVPVAQADQVSKILDSYRNYSQIKFFSAPVKNSFKILLILMTLLVVFAGIWGSLIYAKNITTPLEQLATAAEKISKGDLNIHIDVISNDEVGMLVSTFNDMTEKLRAHTEELKSKNEQLSEMYNQISKDKKYIDTVFKNVKSSIYLLDGNKNILKKNETAESLSKHNNVNEKIKDMLNEFCASKLTDKNIQTEVTINGDVRIIAVNMTKIIDESGYIPNFVVVIDDITDILNLERINVWKEMATRIAHEIKNPLTPIKLNAERVLKKITDMDESNTKNMIRNSMKTIINEVNELYVMVQDFSSFSKTDIINKEEFNLIGLIDDLKKLYHKTDREIHFKVSLGKNPLFYGDKQQMKRMFLNLINNALDATKENNGYVVIDVKYDKDLHITIEDNGQGIKDEDISKLFMPYFSTKPDGTGLGLAIVKKIVENHSGKIYVKSNTEDFTQFTIILPAGKDYEYIDNR